MSRLSEPSQKAPAPAPAHKPAHKPYRFTDRPSTAVPRETLDRAVRAQNTIRFDEPRYQAPPKSADSEGPRGSAGPSISSSSASVSKRADSLVPPPAGVVSGKPRRKSTVVSLFQSRSWSIFWDPKIRATTGGDAGDGGENQGVGRSCDAGADEVAEERHKRRSFLSRCKNDRLLHVVLGMVVLVGSALIVAGVVWSVTHERRVMEDKRDFVCGKGIAGGPRCAVRLKGDEAGMQDASWLDGEVVDWWLKNHCVWRGKEGEWWCGAGIGQKEGEEDAVLPEGTWLERVEEEGKKESE